MEPQIKFELNEIKNINQVINEQVVKFNEIRRLIKELKFVPVDTVGAYSSVTYKSIDGGKMGISFHPFEFDFIVVADSVGNELMNYLVPKSESLTPKDFQYLDKFPQVQRLLNLLNLTSIIDLSTILSSSRVAMMLTEYAYVFERLTREKDEPTRFPFFTSQLVKHI